MVRTILKLWLLVRERNKEDNSNLVIAVAYLDTGKYLAWICGYLTAQCLGTSECRLLIAIPATGMLLSMDAPVMSAGGRMKGSYKGSMADGNGRNNQQL